MTVYIVDIEAVDTRYTKQWKEHLPDQLQRALVNDAAVLSEVEVISGGDVPQSTTPGAFLNFGGTNVYKSNQLMQIATLFCSGRIRSGDYFLYTDAWNPTVIQLKYMARLLGVDIRIGGMWHAGSYDPQDFLGRLIGDEPWVRDAERSMYSCYDDNYFATQFHIDLFEETYTNELENHLPVQVGWPMEYLRNSLTAYAGMEKQNLILFPHRVAPEKQVDIFRDLAEALPEYKFVVCQEQELTKNEYHNMLGEAKLVFSANLQETLGISWYEGALVDAIPMVPDRLSYSEMSVREFVYPSEWTESYDKYLQHKKLIVARIQDYMENYSRFLPAIHTQVKKLETEFFSGKALYKHIRESIL
jgi:hypothetical protein